MSRYLELLESSSKRVGTSLCVGIDPDPAQIPSMYASSPDGVRQWVQLLVRASEPHAAAYKVNIAFFEALGSDGWAIAEEIRDAVPRSTPLIVDAKRGDIGNTVRAQARSLFDVLGADAVTANPYLGIGSLAPLLERDDRFVYLLCRTSNPESAEFQEAIVGPSGSAPAEALYLRVARQAEARPEARAGRIGLVAGATAGDSFTALRSAAPSLPLLVPGVGAQGGDVELVVQHGAATSGSAARRCGGGLLVNVGRGISWSSSDEEVARSSTASLEVAVRARAAEWARRLAILAT